MADAKSPIDAEIDKYLLTQIPKELDEKGIELMAKKVNTIRELASE